MLTFSSENRVTVAIIKVPIFYGEPGRGINQFLHTIGVKGKCFGEMKCIEWDAQPSSKEDNVSILQVSEMRLRRVSQPTQHYADRT